MAKQQPSSVRLFRRVLAYVCQECTIKKLPSCPGAWEDLLLCFHHILWVFPNLAIKITSFPTGNNPGWFLPTTSCVGMSLRQEVHPQMLMQIPRSAGCRPVCCVYRAICPLPRPLWYHCSSAACSRKCSRSCSSVSCIFHPRAGSINTGVHLEFYTHTVWDLGERDLGGFCCCCCREQMWRFWRWGGNDDCFYPPKAPSERTVL